MLVNLCMFQICDLELKTILKQCQKDPVRHRKFSTLAGTAFSALATGGHFGTLRRGSAA